MWNESKLETFAFFHNEKAVCVTLLMLVHGLLLFGNFPGRPLGSSQRAGTFFFFLFFFLSCIFRKGQGIIDNKQIN